MKLERRTLDTLDVPLPGGRVLRLALYLTSAGEPETLVLTLGWGEGRVWRECIGDGLTLPADVLPALRAALDALADLPRKAG